MQLRTDLPPCADHPFLVRRQSDGAGVAAALTLICAIGLALFSIVTGWPL